MGVRILEGTYDGTSHAAVMVDSTNGCPVGPIFEGGDAVDQIEAFQAWLCGEPYMAYAQILGLEPSDIPDPRLRADDPRNWSASGLRKLVAGWRTLAGVPA